MAKVKTETVTTKDEDGNELILDVKYPSGKQVEDAKIIRTRHWNKFVDEGIKVKRQIDEILKEKGIWTDKQENQHKVLVNKITKLGKELSDTSVKKTRKRGREIAIAILKTRNELRDLLEERNALDANSAEALAENVWFDYLVSVCVVYNKDGKPFFEDYDDYIDRKSEKAAWDAASKLASMIYGGVDFSENYQDNLIEVQFLKKFKFVDEDGNFIDSTNGEKVDIDGKPTISPPANADTDVYGNKIVDGKVEFTFGGFEEAETSE